MKNAKRITISRAVYLAPLIFLVACTSPGNKTSKMKADENKYEKGTYGYDVAFLSGHKIATVELKDSESKACILLAPGYQGRVMTSAAGGNEGQSFGWINYKLIESGEIKTQFNPVGGEERFWLGPEGGPFSIYFAPGKEQVYENWLVPPVLDTEKFEIKEQNPQSVTFIQNADLTNASGTNLKLNIERRVSLLDRKILESIFKITLPGNLNVVAYQSENKISNAGDKPWEKESGLLSVWMLCMFNPSPTTTVFIPYNTESKGAVVNDDYFGKVPADRLIVDDGTIFFKIDGAYRSKIGLPPGRATGLCGSYDSDKKILTLLWCSLPAEPKSYVNSKWGEQDNPYEGDVINSYNDGPVADGSIMGPFYEIETSSPAADLQPGASIVHTQLVAHIQGDETALAGIVKTIFHLDLQSIASKFNQ